MENIEAHGPFKLETLNTAFCCEAPTKCSAAARRLSLKARGSGLSLIGKERLIGGLLINQLFTRRETRCLSTAAARGVPAAQTLFSFSVSFSKPSLQDAPPLLSVTATNNRKQTPPALHNSQQKLSGCRVREARVPHLECRLEESLASVGYLSLSEDKRLTRRDAESQSLL